MRNFFIILTILTLIACGKDDVTYPKLYTFSQLDQTEEGLYVLTSPNTAKSIDLNTGIYGSNRDLIKSDSEEFIKAIFDLQEIELLSKNTVRVNYIYDEIEIDTIYAYSLDKETIVIENLTSTDLIYHDSENDQFVLCGFTLVALPGPNTVNPGSDYNTLILEDCQENADLNDHLNYVIEQNTYETLDTLGLIIYKFIYK